MTIEFLKAHMREGRHFAKGQIVDISDDRIAQDLIRQGIAKAHKAGEAAGAAAEPDEAADKPKEE